MHFCFPREARALSIGIDSVFPTPREARGMRPAHLSYSQCIPRVLARSAVEQVAYLPYSQCIPMIPARSAEARSTNLPYSQGILRNPARSAEVEVSVFTLFPAYSQDYRAKRG